MLCVLARREGARRGVALAGERWGCGRSRAARPSLPSPPGGERCRVRTRLVLTTGGERGSPLGPAARFGSPLQFLESNQVSPPLLSPAERQICRQAGLRAGCPTEGQPAEVLSICLPFSFPPLVLFFFSSPPTKDSRGNVILLLSLGPKKTRFEEGRWHGRAPAASGGGSPAGIGSRRNLGGVNAIEYLPVISLHTFPSPDACCLKAVSSCQKRSGKPRKD